MGECVLKAAVGPTPSSFNISSHFAMKRREPVVQTLIKKMTTVSTSVWKVKATIAAAGAFRVTSLSQSDWTQFCILVACDLLDIRGTKHFVCALPAECLSLFHSS